MSQLLFILFNNFVVGVTILKTELIDLIEKLNDSEINYLYTFIKNMFFKS